MTDTTETPGLDEVTLPCGMVSDTEVGLLVTVAVRGYRTDPDPETGQGPVWTDLAIQVQDADSGDELGGVGIPRTMLAPVQRLIAAATEHLDQEVDR